ncbi:MAG TPA: TIGR03085 family metal-binding protein, partial [Frankiaceae bacterium]|nr:TIGR03085 family metal-binding protein [Frankiaceae bacterium]
MGRHSVATAERQALCDLLDELGPDAPTLCDGWTTGDLAAHLLTRESRADAGPGLLLPRLFGAHAERLRARTRARVPYEELVRRLRGGPPLLPYGLPVLRDELSLGEFFVHQEDVRRAQPGWRPRPVSPELDQALWRRLRRMAPLLLRRARGVAVLLTTPDGRRAPGRGGTLEVQLAGTPAELFLYAFNRRGVAAVQVSGSPAG